MSGEKEHAAVPVRGNTDMTPAMQAVAVAHLLFFYPKTSTNHLLMGWNHPRRRCSNVPAAFQVWHCLPVAIA
ncbi:hypothetical protein AW736_12510 [Termitidicoccus mucosus]|uniref:Uncharacterized protein n=1 Tax=Termitidicoccus mucosus TaxID=1184151 RepID=A0A178IHZ6_9BACT|nr:hypothetical protein AW736_12510 [Opitutaceae bacterium TSB47]